MAQITPSIPVLWQHSRALSALLLRLLLLVPAFLAATVLMVTQRRHPQAPVVIANDLHRPAELELTVVIPFFNPGDALRPTVAELVAALQERGISYEVLAVSDGSTDGSEATIADLPGVRVIVQPCNRGKGAALHAGFSQARGRYLGMVDADGDIDPVYLCDYLHRAQVHDLDVVYANKYLDSSRSAASRFRKTVSRGFVTFVSALFDLGVEDTQTGCKLFRRDAMAQVLPRMREERFAFDLEFFVAAREAGIRRMQAAPVELRERMAGSTVGAKAILRTVREALTIFGRLHLTSTYREHHMPTLHLPTHDDVILQAA
ncbi:MAG: glycosyltransferase family 2 protein [Candidatus Nanopelagicales bacterium]